MASQVAEERAPSCDAGLPSVEFRTDPPRYRHWRLALNGPVASLTMGVDEH
jgi:benzoyl-CoA-dihydrodiol lyase